MKVKKELEGVASGPSGRSYTFKGCTTGHSQCKWPGLRGR